MSAKMSHKAKPPESARWTLRLLGLAGLGLGALVLTDVWVVPGGPAEDSARGVDAVERHRPMRLGPRSAASPQPNAGLPHARVVDAAQQAQAAYAPHMVMVAPIAGRSLQAVADAHGVDVARAVGPSGYGALEVPAGVEVAAFVRALRGAGDVAGVAPTGVLAGAGATPRTKAIRGLQWHLDTVRHPIWELDPAEWDEEYQPDFSAWVVAVLDTGVAYRDGASTGAAPSLAKSAFVSPADFVNDDALPDDDHQHGTHIASLIASDGDVMGVAPGVGLMPIKVLDENNSGYEIDLVNGIHHAVDNGADVINMSLSFSPGYLPSAALLDALQAAADADVVLVAASGNDGGDEVTWPAACREVIAVAATAPKDKSHDATTTAYSNVGPLVDLSAPGGDLRSDENEDGVADGVLAETFDPDAPGSMGVWLYGGTSQAAAVVSGAAVHLLDAGATADQVRMALQFAAKSDLGSPYEDGWGAGAIELDKALEALADGKEEIAERQALHVALMPYVESHSDGEKLRAVARVAVVDDAGSPVKDIEVYGVVQGSAEEVVHCKTDGDGLCTMELDEVDVRDEDDNITDPGLAWLWRIDSAVRDGIAEHPGVALFATDGFEVLAAAASAEPDTADGLLAVRWGEFSDDELGDLAESYLVLNGGTGLVSHPLGLVFTPAALDGFGSVEEVEVDLDGTGLVSHPLGLASMWVLTIDGTGLVSHPLGLSDSGILQFTAFDGTGLVSHPLGFSATHLFMPGNQFDGTGLVSHPLGFDSNPMLFSGAEMLGSGVSNSALAGMLSAGGWVNDAGFAGASLVMASGFIEARALKADDGLAAAADQAAEAVTEAELAALEE